MTRNGLHTAPKPRARDGAVDDWRCKRLNIEERRYRAYQLRYRKAALAIVQRSRIDDELYDIAEECSDLEWTIADDESLIDVFDEDTDEIHDFRMMFSDLSVKCDKLQYELRNEYVTEHFDDFFVGTLDGAYSKVGFDEFEEDYMNLTRYEAELAQGVSGKR